MHFTKSLNKEPDPPVNVEGYTLRVVQVYKYFGIIIDSKL